MGMCATWRVLEGNQGGRILGCFSSNQTQLQTKTDSFPGPPTWQPAQYEDPALGAHRGWVTVTPVPKLRGRGPAGRAEGPGQRPEVRGGRLHPGSFQNRPGSRRPRPARGPDPTGTCLATGSAGPWEKQTPGEQLLINLWDHGEHGGGGGINSSSISQPASPQVAGGRQ